LPDVKISVSFQMVGLDFDRGVHDVLRSLIAIAIPARRQMMARRSIICAGAEKQDEAGCNLAASTVGMRAQLDIPRRRKTISPLRASAGSASPSMAERNLS
jgi:uncharacterized protein (DUF3084 family)